MRPLPKKFIFIEVIPDIVVIFAIFFISISNTLILFKPVILDTFIFLILAIINLILLGAFITFIVRKKKKNRLQEKLEKTNLELEEKVKIASAELTHIFERFTDAYIGLDKNWNYTYINTKAAELIKRDSKDLIGRNVWEEYPKAIELSLYQAYHKAFNEQEYAYHEHYYEPFDVWIENHILPLI